MSHFVTKLPRVVVKPGRMITPKLKAFMLLLVLLLYIYVLLYLKTFYLKSKKLDRILEMALETENKMLNVHNMNQKLAMKLAQIEKIYEDY